MHPDQARFLFNFLFPHLKTERATTRKILSAVPADRSDYAPHPNSLTALKLCGHIAGTEIWFLDAILTHSFSDDDDTPPPKWNTPADVIRWYDEKFADRLPRIEALSNQHLMRPVNYIGILNEPAVTYLSLAIRHSVHHRGQLSAYLRPMGAKVPSIYVESGDQRFAPGESSGW
ncbi:MAG TPA: DinB family protein [Candidatus Acidoferrum sp.]